MNHMCDANRDCHPRSRRRRVHLRARDQAFLSFRARQLLHMNSRALELTGHPDQTELGPVHDFRSAQVRELSAQIQETLDHRREADIWEIFELKRVIFETERKILVRGFGLADRKSHDASRIVIVLEEIGFRQARPHGYPSESRLPIVEEPALRWAHEKFRTRA